MKDKAVAENDKMIEENKKELNALEGRLACLPPQKRQLILDSTKGANAQNGWNPDFETPSLFGLNQPGGLLGTKAKSAFSGLSGLDLQSAPTSPQFRANQQLLGQNGGAGGLGGGIGGLGSGDMGDGLNRGDLNGFNLRIMGNDKDGKPIYEKFAVDGANGANGSLRGSNANGTGADANGSYGTIYTGGFFNADGSPYVATGKNGKQDVYDNKGNLISKDGGVTFLGGKSGKAGSGSGSGSERENRLALLKGQHTGQQWEDQQLIQEHERNTRILRTAYEREQQRQLELMGEMKSKITIEKEE